MQQLQAFGKEFEAFKGLNTDIVAVGTDDPVATKSLKQNAEGIKFPMPILADPSSITSSLPAFDDFEGIPLHGTFLIDPTGSDPISADLPRAVPRRRIPQEGDGACEQDREVILSGPRSDAFDISIR